MAPLSDRVRVVHLLTCARHDSLVSDEEVGGGCDKYLNTWRHTQSTLGWSCWISCHQIHFVNVGLSTFGSLEWSLWDVENDGWHLSARGCLHRTLSKGWCWPWHCFSKTVVSSQYPTMVAPPVRSRLETTHGQDDLRVLARVILTYNPRRGATMWVSRSELCLSHPSQFRGTALGEIPKLDCCLLMQEHVGFSKWTSWDKIFG